MTNQNEDAEMVEVSLESLCVIVETASRAGLHVNQPLFPAYKALPKRVHERLHERSNERTERTLTLSRNSILHLEGKPHDEATCGACADAMIEKLTS